MVIGVGTPINNKEICEIYMDSHKNKEIEKRLEAIENEIQQLPKLIIEEITKHQTQLLLFAYQLVWGRQPTKNLIEKYVESK